MDLSEILAYRPGFDEMTAAEIAAKALAILNEKGWCKGALRYRHTDGWWPEGSHCVAGALNLVMLGTPMWGPGFGREDVYRKLADVILAEFPERMEGWDEEGGLGPAFAPGVVVHFNNHEDTILEDVRLVLEKVAAG